MSPVGLRASRAAADRAPRHQGPHLAWRLTAHLLFSGRRRWGHKDQSHPGVDLAPTERPAPPSWACACIPAGSWKSRGGRGDQAQGLARRGAGRTLPRPGFSEGQGPAQVSGLRDPVGCGVGGTMKEAAAGGKDQGSGVSWRTRHAPGSGQGWQGRRPRRRAIPPERGRAAAAPRSGPRPVSSVRVPGGERPPRSACGVRVVLPWSAMGGGPGRQCGPFSQKANKEKRMFMSALRRNTTPVHTLFCICIQMHVRMEILRLSIDTHTHTYIHAHRERPAMFAFHISG